MSKSAMISMPMAGKSETQIKNDMDKAKAYLESLGYNVVNTLFTNGELERYKGVVVPPLYFLAKSLESMSKVTTVYFCNGWEDYRGCILEHGAAKAYGLNIIYESDNASALR